MDTLGKHILCEMSGVHRDVLNDVDYVRKIMLAAAVFAGATVIGDSFNTFEPQGVSGVVVISESHLSIHTWPERGYAALDFYTCGKIDPRRACGYIASAFKVSNLDLLVVRRGLETSPEVFEMKVESASGISYRPGDDACEAG